MRGKRELLGKVVFDRITAHLEQERCEGCQAAVALRRERLRAA